MVVSYETRIEDKKILLNSYLESEYSKNRNQLTRMAIDTQEEAIRQALIQLGWTPPKEDDIKEEHF